MSNKKAIESTEMSNGFIKKTIVTVYRLFNDSTTTLEEQKIVNIMSYPIRKLAHFTIYLILGILVYLTAKVLNPSYNRLFLSSLLICIIYACSDEFHQLFIIGRSGELKDVLIDSLGSLIGIYLCNFRKNLIIS